MQEQFPARASTTGIPKTKYFSTEMHKNAGTPKMQEQISAGARNHPNPENEIRRKMQEHFGGRVNACTRTAQISCKPQRRARSDDVATGFVLSKATTDVCSRLVRLAAAA
jgi:hypothetical protein